MEYRYLDSGFRRKLEQFGSYTIIRPAPLAVWAPRLGEEAWGGAAGQFTRETSGEWIWHRKVKPSWTLPIETDAGPIKMRLAPTEFGHLGLFAEHLSVCNALQKMVAGKQAKVLNLFAYTGLATLFAAKGGAAVTHLDASKPVVTWARENAQNSGLGEAPIRWIVDDAMKFTSREIKRNNLYDLILLDPPTFGRGANKEVFKIEEHILELLENCIALLSEKPIAILFTCHTPGYTVQVIENLLGSVQFKHPCTIEVTELHQEGENTCPLPNGVFAKVVFNGK
ncbi:MAG: Ribosomal RNA large subunit methyltransferase K/L [Chlamydiia bacterium]|nr:Ribosomal RNA large subunit methyltransferase K/L [Chlamydiia bacterium]